MLDTYGFRAIKLKGGVFPPEEEIEAVFALRDAFPGVPLRLDPNTAWSVDTSIHVGTDTRRGARVPRGSHAGTYRAWPRWRARSNAARDQHVRGGVR